MSSRRRVRAVVLAALLAAAISLAIVISGSTGSYELEAVFDQTHGLVKGADVKAAGKNVGRVTRIELGSDGYPHVRLEISDAYRLRRGGTADLRFFSVTGEANRYIALHQGEGPELPDGATVGLAESDQPVEIDQLIDTLNPATRRSFRRLIAGLDTGLLGRGPDIERTLQRSARALAETTDLLGQVDADGPALRTLVRRGRQVVGALADDPEAVGGTAQEMATLLETTGRHQAALAAGVARLPGSLRSVRSALDRVRSSLPALSAFVTAARPAIAELVPTSVALRPLLRSSGPFLKQARLLTTQAPRDLPALMPLLETAPPIVERLATVLEPVNPMLDEARARFPDFFSFISNWGDFSANYDANGHGARIGLVLAPPPTNPIGPSDSTAGFLARPFLRTPGVLEGEPWRNFEDSFLTKRGSGR